MTNDETDASTGPDPVGAPGIVSYRVEHLTDADGTTSVVVHVRGELDAHGAEGLTGLFAEAFLSGPDVVIADLHELAFIDSVGIGVLVGAHTRGLAEATRFEVHRVSPGCLKVLEITQLTDVLDLR
jgi:anti-sigma B factor antagonist